MPQAEPAAQSISAVHRWPDKVSRWTRDHHQLLLVLVLLLSFVLRIYRLAVQDIWWDEASSALQAPMSLQEITLYQARDQHPPLYYWQLHFYYRLMGSSLWALRLFSVAWGVLGVAVAYVLGKRLFYSTSLGLLGALLLAISRFHIAWSQEIKMYAMLSTLSMLSLLLVWYILEDRGWLFGGRREVRLLKKASRVWLYIAYVAVSILSIYCHYIALLGLVGQNLYVLGAAIYRRHRREHWLGFAWRWALAQATILAVALPWFLLHAEQSMTWTAAEPTPFVQAMEMVATLLSQGISAYVERYTAKTIVLWLPLVLAPLFALRFRDRAGLALLWLAMLASVLLAYALTLPGLGFGYEAKLAARFFILAQTPYCVLLAHGLARLRRKSGWLGSVAMVVVLVLQIGALREHYQERYPRDSYTTLTRTIQSLAREGDAILLMTDSEWPVFHYYYEGHAPIYHVPYGAQGGERVIDPYVLPVHDQHEGIWLVVNADARRQDSERAVVSWLRQHRLQLLDEPFGERRLMLFRRNVLESCYSGDDGLAPQFKTALAFDEGPLLIGFDQAVREVRAGQRFSFVTYWETEPGLGYTVQIYLQEPGSNEPVIWSEPKRLSSIASSCAQRVRSDIPISRAVPRGLYRIILRVQTHQERWTVPLGAVVVRDVGTQEIGALAQSLNNRFGQSIALKGYEPDTRTLKPGQYVRLALSWECLMPMQTSYTVFVHLLGEQINPEQNNPLWGQVDAVPMQGSYPTYAWVKGDVVQDVIEVTLDQDAPAGVYAIEVGIYNAQTGERLTVYDGAGMPIGDHIILDHVRAESATRSLLSRWGQLGGPSAE